MHEAGINPFRFFHQVDDRESLHDLFPQDRQLQFRQAIADAAMNAEPERQMLPGTGAIDDEFPAGAL